MEDQNLLLIKNPTQDTVMKRMCKIEKAGVGAVNQLFDLVKNSDLSYSAMAKLMDERFPGFNITKPDVVYFFRTHTAALNNLIEEQRGLTKVRAELFLDSEGTMVKDIKILDAEITKLLTEDGKFTDPDKRAKAIAQLIDTKGRILMRKARLSGTLVDSNGTKVEKMEVNIYNQINSEKSDIIQRLRKAEFSGDTVDVTPHENKKTDN